MGKKASIKYRSLRSNLIHLPLSLYAQLAQSQTVSPRRDPSCKWCHELSLTHSDHKE